MSQEGPVSESLLNFLIGGGSASVLALFARGAWRWATGRAGRERIRKRTIADERDLAQNQRDEADAYRGVISEHARELRGILIELGYKDRVPAWPERPAPRTPDEQLTRRELRQRRQAE